MKKYLSAALIAITCLTAGTAGAIGKTAITAYGTYWNSNDPGYGAGLKLSKTLLDMLYLDARGGYVNFDQYNVTMIPVEASLNIGFPGMITPYVGVGAGYYFTDSPVIDDQSGYFGQIGIELNIAMLGVMAELRYHDLETTAFDDMSVNIGVQLKF